MRRVNTNITDDAIVMFFTEGKQAMYDYYRLYDNRTMLMKTLRGLHAYKGIRKYIYKRYTRK